MNIKRLTNKQLIFTQKVVELGKKEATKCAELAGYQKNPEKWAVKLLKIKEIKDIIKTGIRPEKSKNSIITKDYLPQLKWTEEKAIELGTELVKWIKEDGNIFVDRFFVWEKDLYTDVVKLLKKFPPFADLLGIAQEIQKIKLSEGGLKGNYNNSITKFMLVNHHGMRDKFEIDSKNLNVNYGKDITDDMTAQEASSIYSEVIKKGNKD